MTNTVVVGQYSMTPQQMEAAGIIKPGTAPLVQSLVNKGTTLANAMPSTIFTGKQGAQNLNAFVQNPQAQASAVQTNLQNSTAALKQAGVITGKESGTQVAGLVKSAATVGLSATVDAVKGVAGKALGTAGAALGAVAGAAGKVTGALTGAAGKALGAIGSGNLAGKLADGLTSGLGSIANSLSGIAGSKGIADVVGAARGIAAAAFSTIKNAFPKMKAGVPVNVAEVAKEAAAKAEEASAVVPGGTTNLLNAVKDKGSGLINGAKGLASGLQNQLSGGSAALGKVASAAQGGAMADFQAAAGKTLGKTTGALSVLGAVSKIAGTAASVAPNAKGGAILGAISSAAGSNGNVQTVLSNTLSGAVQGAVSGVVNKALDKATGGISTKVLATSSVINSITGTKATGIAGAFGSVTSVISNPNAAVKGAFNSKVAGGVSALASGITNLPGGSGAIGALVNKAGSVTGKLGTLGGALDKLGGDIANKFSAELNKITPTLDAAASLAKSGFPAGAAAQLEAQISSISSGGAIPISMPVVALNTTNRAEISAQNESLLGDPGIPAPNQLGEVSQGTVDKYEAAQKATTETYEELGKLASKGQAAFYKAAKLDKAFEKAKSTLPQGDPKIQEAYDAYMAASVEYADADKEFKEFKKKYNI